MKHSEFVASVLAAAAAAAPGARVAPSIGAADAAERIAAASAPLGCVWPSGRIPAPGAPGALGGASRRQVSVGLAAAGAVARANAAARALEALDLVELIERAVLQAVPGCRYLGAMNQTFQAPAGMADLWVLTFESVG